MKHTVLLYVSALVLPLLAACTSKGDDTRSYDRFVLHTRVGDANTAAKTTWDINGLWWEEGDKIKVNGKDFTLEKRDGTWYATGEETSADASGNFNICYPSLGSFDINSGDVPLAAVTSSNNVTLNPCCAVVRVSGGSGFMAFYDDDGNNALNTGAIYENGNINIAGNYVEDGSGNEIEYSGIEAQFSDGEFDYFVLPMGSEDVNAYLEFDYGEHVTNFAVTLSRGKLYTITF